MAFTEKIKIVVDVVANGANQSIDGLKGKLNDADGAFGKMKVGASAAFDSIKAHAATAMIAAGAALVTFGAKAVTAFTDAALASGKFADATGLGTETASRWVAVADDIGISSEAMEKAFGKLAVSVGKNNPLLEQYGITVQKGANGQNDMNATMLHAIDVINGIQDPTKKAAVAQAALGKGWMDMAELIGQGSTSLTKSMAEVSEAQVIDPAEVEKARKMRAAMDDLSDAVTDVALVLGEQLVPAVTTAAKVLVPLIGGISDVTQGLSGGSDIIGEWAQKFAAAHPELQGFVGTQEQFVAVMKDAGFVTDDVTTAIEMFGATIKSAGSSQRNLTADMEGGISATEVAEQAQRALTDQSIAATEATEDLARENKLLADAIKTTTDRYKALKGELDAEEAFHNAEGMWRDLQASAEEAMTAAGEGTDEASQKMFDHQSAVIAAKQKVVELGDQYADLPPEKITEIVALIDQGKLNEAEAAFNNLARARTLYINLQTRNGGGTIPGLGVGAAGGVVTRPTMALIGEAGPEAVVPLSQMPGASALPGMGGGVSSGGSPIYVTVNAGLGANGKEIGDLIVGELKKYTRRNGPGWVP